MAKITYRDKIALNPMAGVPIENKIMDTDMNEIKESVNWLYDNPPVGGVSSVSGNLVDNTDPVNPVIDMAVSSDAGNNATLGSDGLVYVQAAGVVSVTGNLVDNTDPVNPVIDMAVSSDAGNDAILGSDGLVYVNAGGGQTGIEVGVTDSDGTDQCVLFQSGGKVQQSTVFKFDPATGRFNINNVASPTAQINVKATSILSSDYFIKLRNPTDAFDVFAFDNAGGMNLRATSSTALWDFYRSNGHHVIQFGVSNNIGVLRIGSNGNVAQFGAAGGLDTRELSAGVYGKGKFGIGISPFAGPVLPNENSTNILFFETGVNPALNYANGYQQYSATNGTFHYPAFRLSDGKVVKLEPQDSTSIATLTDLVNALINTGLLY